MLAGGELTVIDPFIYFCTYGTKDVGMTVKVSTHMYGAGEAQTGLTNYFTEVESPCIFASILMHGCMKWFG